MKSNLKPKYDTNGQLREMPRSYAPFYFFMKLPHHKASMIPLFYAFCECSGDRICSLPCLPHIRHNSPRLSSSSALDLQLLEALRS